MQYARLITAITFWAVLLFPNWLWAQGQTAASAKKASSVGLTTVAEISSNTYVIGDPAHSSTGTLYLFPSAQISDSVRMTATLAFDKELTGKRDFHTRNGKLGFRWQSMAWSPVFKFSPGLAVGLPFSETSRDRDSYVTSLRLEPRLLFDLEPWGLEPVNGMWQVTALRNFHSFNTKTDGRSNDRYIVTNWLQTNLSVHKRLTLTANVIYTWLWTYAGNRRNQFEISEEAAFSINDAITLAVGHSNSGNAIRPNGMDSAVDVFDERNSVFYASVSLSY